MTTTHWNRDRIPHPNSLPEEGIMNGTTNGHIFKCLLCTQSIQRGKSLNCHHAFCHHCIQNNHISSKYPDKVICPVKTCRQTTPLPSKIIADLADFNEKEILLRNNNRIEEFAEVGSSSVSSTTAFTKAAETVSTTMAPSGKRKGAKAAGSEAMSPLKSVQIQLSETKSSSTPALTANKANGDKPSKACLSTGVKSILQTPEQIRLLKEKQSHFNKQMSMPDQTSPPPMEGTSSNNKHRRRLQRSQSEMLPENNTIIKLNKPKYQSTLKNDEQRAALQRMIERNKIKPKTPKIIEEVEEGPRPRGFTSRTSKRRAPKGSPAHGNIFQGGISSFFLAAKQSEFEFRSRNEGPWGYQDWEHWDGRTWGEAD